MPSLPNAAPTAHSATTRAFVQWIRLAAPYIHAFRGKTFVIAFGGEVVADDTFLGIIHDLNLLHSLGVHIVVVHGSRPQIEAILKAAGSDLQHVLRCGVFLVDMREFQKMNASYARMFGEHRPARTTVQVAGLPGEGLLVEIDAIAYVP